MKISLNDFILWLIPLAFILDLLIGDPVYAWHPVRIIGNRIISPLDNFLRGAGLSGRGGGLLLLLATLTASVGPVLLVNDFLGDSPLFFPVNLFLIYSCLAIKDLRDHTRRVMEALTCGELKEARKLLSLIVGRETGKLDKTGISRACLETLAENLSDGIVAPLFYAVIGGAPLIILYKATNTLDSMVGYKNEKYRELGWCSARFDDILNWVPARISLALVLVAGWRFSLDWPAAWRIALRDRLKHSSPNSAHPEAALAGVLNLRLGGPDYYQGQLVEKPFLNEPGNEVTVADVETAWKIAFAAAVLSLILFMSGRFFL
ncbi:MAG: adenosylcobinamide-phosphate synthase CbiB [bacterium]